MNQFPIAHKEMCVSQPTCDIMSSSLEKSRHWRGKTSIFQAKKPFKRKGSDKEKERKRDVSVSSSEDFPQEIRGWAKAVISQDGTRKIWTPHDQKSFVFDSNVSVFSQCHFYHSRAKEVSFNGGLEKVLSYTSEMRSTSRKVHMMTEQYLCSNSARFLEISST